MPFVELFFWLLVGHALADYAFQSQYMASAKDHTNPENKGKWPVLLGFHSMIHGGAVAFATGYIWLGILEVAAHFAIDYAKSAGWFGQGARALRVDQGLHVACKVLWAIIALALAAGSVPTS